MTASAITARIKPWILPASMAGGLILHDRMAALEPLAPWLIFIMLFITFCRVEPKELRFTALSWRLLGVQMIGGIAVYLALMPINEDLAQGTFICVFCPTATAAPVVTGMLGGSISRVATYSILSNPAVAVTAPGLFTMMGSREIDFLSAAATTASRVIPLIIAPLITAMVLRWVWPAAHRTVARKQSWSFAIWAVSLFIVVGRAVSFVISEPADRAGEMVAIAMCAGVVCVAQFYIGRRIGARCGDKIAGAQSLGQKNTVLAIWMALTWLNPVSSVGPAAYVAWQNTINSWQIYRRQKQARKPSADNERKHSHC